MRKALTIEQQEKAAQRRDQFRQLVKRIADMPTEDRLALAANVGIISCEGRALSLTNTILIVMQSPQASMVGGFRQWLKQGRAVCKGQHGISIWVPIGAGKRDPDNASETAEPDDVRFMMGTVFDVSQTLEVMTAAA